MSELLPSVYWEERARSFAHRGAGLKAVCSYGMPSFYNRAIDLCQRLALEPWLAVTPGMRVLDVGCGVGRWSRELARRGAFVTGIDLSPTMIEEARRRARADGVGGRCHFQVEDLSQLDLGERFPLVVCVTVLQHILEPERLQTALRRLASHLDPGGRLVLLEAAPSQTVTRCDTKVFQARDVSVYLDAFAGAGLAVEGITGVDPMPFKTRLLPHYRHLPRPVAIAALLGTTAISLPIDALFGRRWVDASWHKVFVMRPRVGDAVR